MSKQNISSSGFDCKHEIAGYSCAAVFVAIALVVGCSDAQPTHVVHSKTAQSDDYHAQVFATLVDARPDAGLWSLAAGDQPHRQWSSMQIHVDGWDKPNQLEVINAWCQPSSTFVLQTHWAVRKHIGPIADQVASDGVAVTSSFVHGRWRFRINAVPGDDPFVNVSFTADASR